MMMSDNIMFFRTPTQVVDGEAPSDRLFRMGGMVVDKGDFDWGAIYPLQAPVVVGDEIAALDSSYPSAWTS